MIVLVETQVREGHHLRQLEHGTKVSFDYVDQYRCHYTDLRCSSSRNSLAEKPQYLASDVVGSTGYHLVSSDPIVEILVEVENAPEYAAFCP